MWECVGAELVRGFSGTQDLKWALETDLVWAGA